MGKNLILSSNRAMLSFSEQMLAEGYRALEEGRAPEGPPFAEGGLAQAISGLLKPGKWRTVCLGSAMADADADVEKGRYDELFETLREQGHAPEHFPYKSQDDVGRPHVRYKYGGDEYSFAQRVMHFNNQHMRAFYEEASNGGIWFAMHMANNFLPDASATYPMPEFDHYNNVQYKSANVTFANANFEEILNSRHILPPEGNEDLSVWLHDYHLMETSLIIRSELCKAVQKGQMEREQLKNVHLGQFIHIPCISAENFYEYIRRAGSDTCTTGVFDPSRQGPKEILEGHIGGLLGNHFIGFHTSRYVQNFIGLSEELFGLEAKPVEQNTFELTQAGQPLCWVGAAPIGVDVDRIVHDVGHDKPLQHTFEYNGDKWDLEECIHQDTSRGKLVVTSVARSDPTKGHNEELETFRELTELIRGSDIGYSDCRLYQVTQKSRQGIEAYRQYNESLERNVELTNQELGEDAVISLTSGIRPPQNYRLMGEADVLFTLPLEDGFNLTTEEGILAQHHKPYEERALLVVGNCGAADHFWEMGYGMEHGIVHADPMRPQEAAEDVFEALSKGYRISTDLIGYVKQNCRVEDWAQYNTQMMREAGNSLNSRNPYFTMAL